MKSRDMSEVLEESINNMDNLTDSVNASGRVTMLYNENSITKANFLMQINDTI